MPGKGSRCIRRNNMRVYHQDPTSFSLLIFLQKPGTKHKSVRATDRTSEIGAESTTASTLFFIIIGRIRSSGIAATAKEPNELIKIVTNACADVEVTSMFSECQHEKTIDIKEELYAAYKAEAERQGLKRPDWIQANPPNMPWQQWNHTRKQSQGVKPLVE